MHPDDLAADIAMVRLVEGEIDRYSLDKRCIRKTGEPIWVRLSVGLIRDESNNGEKDRGTTVAVSVPLPAVGGLA